MSDTRSITDHYTSGDLLARLEARLREDGVDPSQPTVEALAPYDHFHGRGLEATEDMAALRKHPAGTADGESRNVTGSSKVGRRVTLSPTVTLTVDRAETRPRPQGRRCLW